jgi:hypothetical protein
VCSEANQAKPYADRMIKFWDILKDKPLEDAEGKETSVPTFVLYILLYFMKPQVAPFSLLQTIVCKFNGSSSSFICKQYQRITDTYDVNVE